MRRRDDKIARAAHIKERTHGTSNEISFSVLDAAKYKETTQRFSLRDLLANRRDTDTQSVSRETGEHVSRETSNHRALAGSHAAEVVLAGGEAESGLNGNPLSKQPNAIRLPTHQVIAKRLRPKRRLVLSACLSSKR